MRFQAFGARESGDGGRKLSQRTGIELLNRDHLHEVRRRETSAQAGYTAGGQYMVRAGGIIAGGFGAVRSEEDTACVPDLRKQGFIVNAQMLRSEGVREFRCFIERPDDYDGAVFVDRFAGNGSCSQGRQLAFDLRRYLRGQAFGSGEQDGAGVGIVLGLSQHVCREEPGSPPDAMIRISVGPATKSIPTSPANNFFAAAT